MRKLLWVMALLAAHPAGADVDPPAQLCERAAAESRSGVPPDVLKAVALTETGRPEAGGLRPWPWTVNREGRGYWFRTRGEALAFASRSIAEGHTSIDLGCFQINFRWHGKGFPSLDAMFDPVSGAEYAARFLRSLYDEHQDWSAAAGAYHSRTEQFAAIYRARFDRIRAGLGAGSAKAAPVDEMEDAPRSRKRMRRRPLIITLDPPRPPVLGRNTDASLDAPDPLSVSAAMFP